MTRPHEKAIAHVAGLADGGLGDPEWRITPHFHPDRLAGGMPILRRMASDRTYLSQFETGADLRRHARYRALEFAELGVSLSRDGYLDPALIGDASRTGRYDEQALKRVWHYVARFGISELAS